MKHGKACSCPECLLERQEQASLLHAWCHLAGYGAGRVDCAEAWLRRDLTTLREVARRLARHMAVVGGQFTASPQFESLVAELDDLAAKLLDELPKTGADGVIDAINLVFREK